MSTRSNTPRSRATLAWTCTLVLACTGARSVHAADDFSRATLDSASRTPFEDQAQAPDLAQRVARLADPDASAAEDEMRALVTLGEPAALEALKGFKEAPTLVRRRRAWVVREAGAAQCIRGAIDDISDPDGLVRATLIEFLGRMELLQSSLEARLDALAERALSDGEPSLRLAAATALSEIGEPAAVERLDHLLDLLSEPERTHAARLLAQNPRATSVVRRRVLEACDASPRDGARPMQGEALSNLLASYGRALADLPSGGETKAERAPFLVFARDADPRVKLAAALAFDTLLRRLGLRGDEPRIQRVLAGLEDQGFDSRLARYHAARLALMLGSDPEVAVTRARDLLRIAATAPGREGRSWLARALSIEACALIAANALDEAEAPIARARQVLDGLLAERVDLTGKGLAPEELQCLHERALCELISAVRRIALECPADASTAPAELSAAAQSAIAADLRRMHVFELEGELCAWRGELGSNGTLDPLLEAEQSPQNLVLENPRLKGWPASRALRVRELLGRALKSVAPSEAPGFEPFPGLPDEVADPLKDPERRSILQRLQYARLDALSKELNDLFERLARRGVRDSAQLSAPEERRIRELRYEMDRTVASVQSGEKNGWKDLDELRVPAWFALNLARELRNDGQAARARAVAAAMRADLEASGTAQKYLWGLELQAEIEMTTGTSYTDDGDPKQAEVELVKAVERLEALEQMVKEREFGPQAIQRLQSLRCGALVSLAVNANVKQGDTDKAVGYFERAWALRQDDSMRVLLACYRARQGRGAEARMLLRSVTPTPLVHYNMACTWALLGEKELALEFLKREFQEGQLSPGGAAKQREWARKDPDLKSLRGDPRFEEIVGREGR